MKGFKVFYFANEPMRPTKRLIYNSNKRENIHSKCNDHSLIRICIKHELKSVRVQTPQSKASWEEFLVNFVVNPACEVLASN